MANVYFFGIGKYNYFLGRNFRGFLLGAKMYLLRQKKTTYFLDHETLTFYFLVWKRQAFWEVLDFCFRPSTAALLLIYSALPWGTKQNFRSFWCVVLFVPIGVEFRGEKSW